MLSRRLGEAFLLLSLCAAAAVVAAPSQPGTADSPTLRKIRDAGVITLGYRAASAPFSYLDDKRHPIGYSMDICRRVVKDRKSTRLNSSH